MKTALKPPGPKVRAMFRKLEALAERGIDGEKLAAQRKLARLKLKFDFSLPAAREIPDLFQGTFKRSPRAKRIYSFARAEFDVANAVKWAIENATGVHCLYRDCELLAEAAPGTIKRLTEIANQISESFRTLAGKFNALNGVSMEDRGAFILGLYDGMMNEKREAGQSLPSRPRARKNGRLKLTGPPASGLHVHPYTVAVSLGARIRYSVPLPEITAELDGLTQPRLAEQPTTP